MFINIQNNIDRDYLPFCFQSTRKSDDFLHIFAKELAFRNVLSFSKAWFNLSSSGSRGGAEEAMHPSPAARFTIAEIILVYASLRFNPCEVRFNEPQNLTVAWSFF